MPGALGGDDSLSCRTQHEWPACGERIREKISQYTFTGGRRLKLSLTASFGAATFPIHASSPQQLISCADTAMYEAKAANKNCVRFSASTVPTPKVDNTLGAVGQTTEDQSGEPNSLIAQKLESGVS